MLPRPDSSRNPKNTPLSFAEEVLLCAGPSDALDPRSEAELVEAILEVDSEP
jgi:hypothetical protein